jgi:serine protease Do
MMELPYNSRWLRVFDMIKAVGLVIAFGIIVALIVTSLKSHSKQTAEQIYDNSVDGVVLIVNGKADEAGGSLGTGFFIFDNLILTNYHVTKGNQFLDVYMHNSPTKYAAKLVASSPAHDLALLEIENWAAFTEEFPNVRNLPLGNSNLVDVGETVFSLGHPWGIEWTLSEGIVSGVGREGGMNAPVQYIQTDANIYQGNSGGPLLNEFGEVVGVNTLMRAQTGGSYGYSIEVKYVQKVLYDFMKYKESKVARLGIGVTSEKIDPAHYAVKIIDHVKGISENAKKCGLEVDDIILEIKNTDGIVKPKSPDTLIETLNLMKMDDTKVTLLLNRNGTLVEKTCDVEFVTLQSSFPSPSPIGR